MYKHLCRHNLLELLLLKPANNKWASNSVEMLLIDSLLLLFMWASCWPLWGFCLSKEFQEDPMPGWTAEILCPFTGILSADLNTFLWNCLFIIFISEHLHSADDLKFKQSFIIMLNKTTFLLHSQVSYQITCLFHSFYLWYNALLSTAASNELRCPTINHAHVETIMLKGLSSPSVMTIMENRYWKDIFLILRKSLKRSIYFSLRNI